MAQERKSEEWNKEVNGNMAARAEDYLESLLNDAFKGKGFQKISELLQEREIEPPQKYSKSLFNQLDKALRKELDKNEFQNVSLLLKCIQLYFKSDLEEGTSLFIEQGLIEKLVSWFERARAFMILIDPNTNKFLMLLLEDFFDSALVICRCSKKGKKEVVNLFLPELGHLVTEANICCTVRQEALRTLNSILDSVPREERKKFPLSEEMCSLTKDLAKTILEVGDYDLQVALSEALCRLMAKKWRDDLVHHWFEDNYLAEAFKAIKDREFETDCRKFLNQLNERLGDERRVYSIPCISAFADMNEVKKPSDEKLEEFWIDFNTGSQSVTFYVDSNEGALWDSVRLSKEAVSSYSLKENDGEKIVKIYMKIPATFNKTEATKIKISFSAEFEILSVLRKVLGDEKMMINAAEEESVHAGKQATQNEAVIPGSTNSQGREDPPNSENMDSLSDNLASQHSQQLTGTVPQKTVNSGVTVITVSQQTDAENANPGSAKKSKTPSPRTKAKPSEKPLEEEPMEESTGKKDVTWEKRNRKTSLAKQRTEGRKEIYDFENSDSASHEKVAEAKGKILGQKVSSQNQRSHEMGNKNEESNKLERRPSSYRKHLFSESNNENTSTGQSEKSWILDSQKQSLPKSLDYTRKRSRVRSKLKVLPMSSASSGSDDQTKKGTSRQRVQKEMLRKKRTSSSKGDDLPTVDLADGMLSEELEGSPLSLDASPKGYSSDEEKATQKFHDPSGNLSREEGSSKRKDSDILSDTVIKKPKFSSWETSHLSSDTSYKSRKLFDSVEKEAEIQTGQEMDDSVDDVFFSKMQSEDFSDSGVTAAFESFIGQLKKLFLSRYKRMETSAQNVLRTSEKNVSTLLNQIHECRLSKLETFHKIVVEELVSVEKETQVLANMEKDAVDFWNMQLLKLNSFCNEQKQRGQRRRKEAIISDIKDTVGANAGQKAAKGGILRFIFIEFSLLTRPWVKPQRVLPTLSRIQRMNAQ
ncbi:synaptonemal complex protein 2-like isoform X3 [Gymnogyps californianus]|uniref:synaptonemal complex protein 2-like isoform X3 n=1 Tax=Gymnogyps californianus TaxID=33616 RepID=UPI0021C70D51|nr:synaptonemal complex protein 2-like isoform X3 [Gymnogyps californianus]